MLKPMALLLLFCLTILMGSMESSGQPVSTLSLDGLDGSTVQLAEYLEKGPVYLTFWALWCEPCKQELRALGRFAKDNEDKPFTIVAVNLDSPKSLSKVKSFVRAQGYPFPVMVDPNMQVLHEFNGQNLPFSVLIDRGGRIVTTRTGYLAGDEREIGEEILKLALGQ